MDGRTDPIEIVARVGGVVPFTDRERALGVRPHLATKAGWQVTTVSGPDPAVPAGSAEWSMSKASTTSFTLDPGRTGSWSRSSTGG